MNKCIVCGAPLIEKPLLHCSHMPSGAMNIPDKENLDNDRPFDMYLYQCSGCGLIQLECEPVPYYRDVIRAGGYNSTMRELRRSQYAHFIDFFQLTGKKIVEVGCGQGEFLQTLTEFPVQAYGVEHSAELAGQAREKGLNVFNAFTENEDTQLPGGPYDAFLSFNFIEHQPDPCTMLRCVYNNLTEDGCGLITAPSFEYIKANDAFYELMRDHVANYTSDTLRFLMERCGFEVVESSVALRDTLTMLVRKRPKANLESMQQNLSELTDQMRGFVAEHRAKGQNIAVWGASHQGFTALSVSQVGQDIAYIIDSAPFKQGRFAPVSHVPIVAPEHFFEEPVSCILIIAPDYTEEISAIIREKFGSEVEIFALRSARIERWGG